MALMIDVGFRAFHVCPCWSERASLDPLPVRHRVDSRLLANPGPVFDCVVGASIPLREAGLGELEQ